MELTIIQNATSSEILFAAGAAGRPERDAVRPGGEAGGGEESDGQPPAFHGVGGALRGALRSASRSVARFTTQSLPG